MVELTESALKELEAYFADKERGSIRIYLAPGGCGGPRLALALDGPGDEDQQFTEGGFSFCVNKDLLGKIGGVSIDLTYMGFTVSPTIPLPDTGSSSCCGCSGASSCGTA